MKNKYLRLVVVLSALLLSVSSLWAERVTQEDAALVAANFLNAGDTTSQGAQAPGRNRPIRRVTLSEEAQYYVYANADGKGWVMIAANDVARPIIAYSDEGEFRADNQPANIKCWLGKYNKQIKQAEADGVQATEEVKSEWKQLRKGTGIRKGTPVVAALIKTKWDQDDPYWNLCPMKGNSHDCYTGCVATAMAQVMNYWQWPVKGTGSYSYTTETLKLSASADFANTTYDWDNMLEKYNGYYPEGSSTWTTSGVPTPTTAQKNAVATLMYHCGVAVAMDYNVASAGGSGAQTVRPNASSSTAKCAQNALYQNFGYKSSIKGYYRPGGYGYSAVSDANWHNYLKTELDAARPIMYAGADDEGGHSFICDGYDNTTPTRKYHFNWGWSGYCDGYYDVDALVPGTGGSGSGNGSYNDDQDIIIGIVPDKPDLTITWSVQGVTSTTTQTSGTLVLPATTPADCASGKKFVGWTASSSVSGSAPADLFTSGSGITVTTNKTYYAVYATETTSPAPRRAKAGTSEVASVTFANASSDGTADKSSSISDLVSSASGISSYSGSKVYAGTTGVKIGSGSATGSVTITLSSSATVKEVKVTAKKYGSDTGTLSVKAGSTTIGSAQSPPASAGELPFTAQTAVENVTTITVATSSKRAYISSITVYEETSGGGGGGSSATYSDYSLSCGEACALTSITLNTNSVKKTFVTNEAFTSEGLVVTANYSNCDSKTVTGSVTAPQMGTAGEKTVTVTYTENSVERTATYKINVVNPYTVTYMACGEEFTTQDYVPGALLVLPTETPVESTGKTFYGWTATEHYTGASAPAKISAGGAVNANATYYAVFH